jgi:hypothetical protein
MAKSNSKPQKAPAKAAGYYISEEDAPKVVRAIEHYAAYMRATNRDDRPYSELAMSLQPFGCCVPNLAFPHSKPN